MNNSSRSFDLLIHTGDDGRLWFCDEAQIPQLWQSSALEFCSSPWVRGARRIRLLGTPETASLLGGLPVASGRADQEILVGSPQVIQWKIGSKKRGHEIARTMAAMREWNRPASLGGFHRVTP